MKVSTIFNIIIGGLLALSITVCIILGCIIGVKQSQLTTLRIEQHHLQQTVKQLRSEEEQRLEIMQNMQERLKKAEEVKDYQEAKRIWLDVWQSLESR